jgi:hypothetical protein
MGAICLCYSGCIIICSERAKIPESLLTIVALAQVVKDVLKILVTFAVVVVLTLHVCYKVIYLVGFICDVYFISVLHFYLQKHKLSRFQTSNFDFTLFYIFDIDIMKFTIISW